MKKEKKGNWLFLFLFLRSIRIWIVPESCRHCYGKGYRNYTTTSEFCHCLAGKRLLKKVNFEELKCPCCKNTGHAKESIGNGNYCTCKYGKKLWEDVQSKKKECPICFNTGLDSFFDDYTGGVSYEYCKCINGRELKEKTKKDPSICPVCHGEKKYHWVDDVRDFDVDELPCPCVKI